MVAWRELRARVRQYYAFERAELRDLLIVVLAAGFIFSFRDWGGETFDVAAGLTHLLFAVLLAALALFVHESAHRMYGLSLGFKTVFRLSWIGMIISLLVVFITNGRIPLLFAGGMVAVMLVRHRLGEFRYGLNYWENGLIALAGPIANLLLAFVFKFLLLLSPESWLFQKGLLMNVVLALCMMLPLPPFDGVNVFAAGRGLWVFSTALLAAIGALLFFTSLFASILVGALLATVIVLVYYITYEQKT